MQVVFPQTLQGCDVEFYWGLPGWITWIDNSPQDFVQGHSATSRRCPICPLFVSHLFNSACVVRVISQNHFGVPEIHGDSTQRPRVTDSSENESLDCAQFFLCWSVLIKFISLNRSLSNQLFSCQHISHKWTHRTYRIGRSWLFQFLWGWSKLLSLWSCPLLQVESNGVPVPHFQPDKP